MMHNLPGTIAGIQLDLKYLMYNKKYLDELVAWLPEHGINTIMIEYEDKFPYQKYPFLRAEDAFTPAELTAFLSRARACGLRVIPLVQSLSHLEFALNHPQLNVLAEAPEIPTQICPSNPESVQLVLDLMQEVLEYHREDEFFHCGGDETWFLGTCEKCAAWKEKNGIINMWVEHQRRILDFIIAQGKKPIVWDDIFWKDFESINRVDLPRETVLMCWNYNITSLYKKNNNDSEDLEFGGASQALKQVEIYHKAGFETFACPCCNYGQLFPRHQVSLANTKTWAQKVNAAGMRGLINSSWACFHVPLQTQLPCFSATAELLQNPQLELDEAWHRNWAEAEFGVEVNGLLQALETVSALWEVPMPEYGRGFSPLGYGYMNMVLHYPGRQDERQHRGAYPNDWDCIDFTAIYQKGLAEVRKGDVTPVFTRLDSILQTYPEAVAVFKTLADGATRNQDTAGLYYFFSNYKYLTARVFSFLLRNDQDGTALLSELISQKDEMTRQLRFCYETEGMKQMLRAWWEPLYNTLKQSCG